VLLAAITITLAVEHPEWSPTGLRGVTEWKTAPPQQIDEFVRLGGSELKAPYSLAIGVADAPLTRCGRGFC
jgi:hypothetical protein